jgi:hypothetical protein
MDILSGQGFNPNGVLSSADLIQAWEKEQQRRENATDCPQAQHRGRGSHYREKQTKSRSSSRSPDRDEYRDDAYSIRSQARSDRSEPISIRLNNGDIAAIDAKTISRIPSLLFQSGEITEAAYKRLREIEEQTRAEWDDMDEYEVTTNKGLSPDSSVSPPTPYLKPALKRPTSRSSFRSATSGELPGAYPESDGESSTAVGASSCVYIDVHDPRQGEHFWVTVQQISANRGAFWWRQMMYCHNRSLVQQYRQWYSLAIEIGVAAVAGVLMGVSVQQFHGELYHGIWVSPYSLLTPAPLNWLVPLYGLLLGIAITLAVRYSRVCL